MSADARIDALYQLPLGEFTPARNALAKELKRADIKTLAKPSTPAWAVNQLYWRERATYDRLVRAAAALRAEHRKLLGGKSAEIREAERVHREAIRDALDAIRAILTDAGQALTPATLTAVQETLEALPSDDAPGRLTKPLKPLGFEALSGMTIRPTLRIVDKPAPSRTTADAGDRDEPKGGRVSRAEASRDRARERALARQREKEERERKEQQRQAARDLKAAEAAMMRAEEAVRKAEQTLAELRARRDEAVSAYQRARLRARQG
jgi:hypothetical protein